MQHVAVAIGLTDVAQGRPGADIAPCHVDRHDGSPGRMFHDGMVDRKLGGLAEQIGAEAEEGEVLLAIPHGALAGAQHGRVDARELAEIGPGAQQEDPAVPEEGATVDEALGRRVVRLLHEAVDGKHAFDAFDASPLWM